MHMISTGYFCNCQLLICSFRRSSFKMFTHNKDTERLYLKRRAKNKLAAALELDNLYLVQDDISGDHAELQ